MATTAPQRISDVRCGRHRESRARSFWSIQRGRPFGEQGSILCGQSRVQGRDPPVFSAGSTGKSQTTHLVSGTGAALTRPQVFHRQKCALFLHKNLTAVPGPVATSSIQSLGQGFRAVGWDTCEAHRALPWVRSTGCGQSVEHSVLAAIPSWALRGEKPRSSRSRPGRAGITPPGF